MPRSGHRCDAAAKDIAGLKDHIVGDALLLQQESGIQAAQACAYDSDARVLHD